MQTSDTIKVNLEDYDTLNNADCTVWDMIDKPIRKLVLNISRLGFLTRFSCCGYPYPGEEYPKAHSANPFIQLYVIQKQAGNFITLVQDAFECGFHPKYIGSSVWVLGVDSEVSSKEWDQNNELHKYEWFAIKIQKFEDRLNEIIEGLEKKQEKDGKQYVGNGYFIDGNSQISNSKDLEDKWLVKPHRSVVIDKNMQIVEDLNEQIYLAKLQQAYYPNSIKKEEGLDNGTTVNND